MKRPMIDAIMDDRAFCWLDYKAGDGVLYEIWLRWQVRHVDVAGNQPGQLMTTCH